MILTGEFDRDLSSILDRRDDRFGEPVRKRRCCTGKRLGFGAVGYDVVADIQANRENGRSDKPGKFEGILVI